MITVEQLVMLRALAEQAIATDEDYDFIAACDPQTILKLVAEVERLRAIEKEHHSDWCVSWTKQLEDLRERAAQVAAGAARICDGPIANMCIAVARDIRALPLVAPEEKP